MRAFRTQTTGAEPTVYACYLYDASGQRVKKLVRKQGGQLEVTHYIGGGFEHHRWGGGANDWLQVMDDKRRIALVRVGPGMAGDGYPAVQYQLGDHLESCVASLDATGLVISAEEFTPYGETSFGLFPTKRYRFTGVERDEESSLTCYYSRSFAAYTCRWTSSDPKAIGTTGSRGANPTGSSAQSTFEYCRSNPLIFTDRLGEDPEDAPNTTQRVPPTDGTTAHQDILPVVAERLNLLGHDTVTDESTDFDELMGRGVLTHPGGSISGKRRGEMDLLVRQLQHDTIVGHVYELKPPLQADVPRTARQVGRYVSRGLKLMRPGGPLAYVRGTMIGDLPEVDRRVVLAPIVVDKGNFIRTYVLWLPTEDEVGFVPGVIAYSFSDKSKKAKEEEVKIPIFVHGWKGMEQVKEAGRAKEDEEESGEWSESAKEANKQAARTGFFAAFLIGIAYAGSMVFN